jgi:hypothetical protein
MKFDLAKVTVPLVAHVKVILEKGAFGLIVLGGSHNLADSVRGWAWESANTCGSLTNRAEEFAEEFHRKVNR